MSTGSIDTHPAGTMLPHGYAGAAIIIAAEALLFLGSELVGQWFTPIVWTGYILLVDALVYRVRGRSLLVNARSEFLILSVISIAGWWLFEFYNAPRFWSFDLELWWHYHNLESNIFVRRLGYDWAFATIFPAMFETAELLGSTVFARAKELPPIRFSRQLMLLMIVMGAVAAVLPLVIISSWLVPLVWLSLVFLLDPLNALTGRPSITADLAQGDYRRLISLLAGGGICGLLWEFWNYWAITRWTYTVPYMGEIKLFEMPVLGYFGFLPFAVECWAMYVFLRAGVLGAKGWDSDDRPIMLMSPKPGARSGSDSDAG